MAIYVDDGRRVYGRYIMCHMAADTTEELLRMVRRIGVSPKHIQAAGTYREHFDVCKSMRKRALQNGAVAVTGFELVRIMTAKKEEVV